MSRRQNDRDETVGAAPVEPTETKDGSVSAEETNLAAELDKLLSERDAAAQARDEYLNLAQRVKADFENYKRRNQNAREEAYTEGTRDTLTKILPVLDNLERAVSADYADKSMKEGVELVLKQFRTILTALGVEEIPAEACEFDPNLHHAVMQEAAPDTDSGQVIAVLQKGYIHNGKVLRHCMVKVSE